MATKMKKPIFIVGEGRSGTTLLKRILAQHPELWAVKSESYIFVKNWPQANPYFKKYAKNLEKLTLAVMTSMKRVSHKAKHFLSSGDIPQDIINDLEEFKNSEYYQNLSSNDNFSHIDIFDAICKFFCEKNNAIRFIEKTPYHINYVKEIRRVYPEAQIIAIYRDPRAVCLSWLKRDKLKNIIGISKSWLKAMQTVRSLKEELPSYSLELVKYEDLIAEPEQSLRSICEWLNIDFDPVLLTEPQANSSFESDRGQSGFNKSALDRWKSSLSPIQTKIINKITQSEHEFFAIEKHQPSLGLIANLGFPVKYCFELTNLAFTKLSKLLLLKN